MTDLLTLGSSGLRAYSRAMGTIGDNIANAQTPGYARRTTQIGETQPASVSALASRAEASSGFRIISTERITNQWRIDDARDASADTGMTGAALGWIEAAENALSQNGADVGRALSGFFNNADALSADPASTTLREQVIASTSRIASAFRQTASALSEVASGIASDAVVQTDRLNGDLTALHRVNISLLRAADGTNNQATLLDERDRLLDNISAAMPIRVSYGEHGEATVSAEAPGNPVMLDASGAANVVMAQASDGRMSFSLTASALPLAPASGSLAGLGAASAHVADQRTALDSFAARVATDLNAVHAAGLDANGNPGGPLFAASPSDAAAFAAIALAATDIAAADSSGPSGNLLTMSSLRGPGGVEAGWAQQMAAQSQLVSQTRSENAAASTRRDAAIIARSEGSAVDLDQEAAELLRFQQAYQAAARVIQLARENMQAILNVF
jgi:flagellar hook-associated protein 1